MKENIESQTDKEKIQIELPLSINNNSNQYSTLTDLPKNCVRIKNKEAEGETKIKTIECLKLPIEKFILFIFLSIITIGIIPLFAKWYIGFRKKMLYTSVSFPEAQYFYITSTDEKIYIEKKLIFTQSAELEKIDRIYFENNLLKYIYNIEKDFFECLEFFDFENINFKNFTENNSLKGLTKTILDRRISTYGKCQLNIPIPTIFAYLAEVLTGPFYILQYLSVILWIAEEFILFSIVLLVVTLLLTILNYIFVRISMLKIKELAGTNSQIKILRDNKSLNNEDIINYSASEELAPGDIFILDKINTLVPCDCLLLSGDALLNESMLNGESTPVAKNSIPNIDMPFNFNDAKNHILFDGTKILELKNTKYNFVYAMALRTGFTSLKGQLVRTVVFPKKTKDEFSSQVIKFILTYAILFGIIYIIYLVKMIEYKLPTRYIVFRLLDAILYVIPPTLTIYLSCCTTFSIIRLKWKRILGLQPDKIIPAGKIDVCCFDKTGTLTKNDIDVIGYLDLEIKNFNEKKNFERNSEENLNLKIIDSINRTHKLCSESIFFKLFSTCHSIHRINNELLGDSLDLQMFKFSQWEYQTNPDPNVKFSVAYNTNLNILDILKVYEFSSESMRMSVIAKDRDLNKTYCFTKGAPEIITKLCKENTIPENQKKILEILSMKGYRILGICYKELSLNIADLNSFTRESAEIDSIFLGFLISENKLKPDTAECILNLRKANIEIKIISGDNPLTTVQASREANITEKEIPVLLIDVLKNNNFSEEINFKIINSFNFTNTNNNSFDLIINQKDLIENNLEQESNILTEYQRLNFILENHSSKCIAITGNLLDYLFLHLKKIEKNKKSEKNKLSDKDLQIINLNKLIFEKCKIFSRMKPEHKAKIVENLQKLNYNVAMIGDGANDCSALKQADIGISFSEAEASFSAPFSSLDTSINCVEKVLLEGRATLLNYIEVFQYIMSSAFIKYFANMILSFSMSYFNDFQFFYVSYLSVLPATLLLGTSPPVDKICLHKPPQDLMGVNNLISIYGQNAISAFALITINFVLKNSSFYFYIPILDNGNLRTKGMENTSLVMVVNILFVFSIFAFVVSSPFKKRFYYNVPLTIWLTIVLIYNTAIIFKRNIGFGGLEYVEFPAFFNFQIFLISYGFGIGMILLQEVLKFYLYNKRLCKKKI